MDGLAALRQIRPRFPDVKVIMFSTHTDRGASATVNALMLGANDYATKPSNEGRIEETLAALRDDLVPKIKHLCAARRLQPAPSVLRSATSAFERASGRMMAQAVVIGVSTGGPAALAAIMPLFPADFPLPIYVVQHMPPLFTRLLAERLDAQCSIKVSEASEGMIVRSGTAIIAAGNYHMKVARRGREVFITLSQDAPVNSCRPAVDVLFHSVREVYGGNVIAVILTGMGHDGQRGSELLKEEGGYVIAQDNASSVVWGMPGAVANTGVADVVLPLDEIVPEILRRMRAA
jgi:two-component system chemotaxis response regulator CheB